MPSECEHEFCIDELSTGLCKLSVFCMFDGFGFLFVGLRFNIFPIFFVVPWWTALCLMMASFLGGVLIWGHPLPSECEHEICIVEATYRLYELCVFCMFDGFGFLFVCHLINIFLIPNIGLLTRVFSVLPWWIFCYLMMTSFLCVVLIWGHPLRSECEHGTCIDEPANGNTCSCMSCGKLCCFGHTVQLGNHSCIADLFCHSLRFVDEMKPPSSMTAFKFCEVSDIEEPNLFAGIDCECWFRFERHFLFTQSQFDSTIGYPGEGPWTLASLNVGSLEKHDELLGTSFDAVALQETRITSTNCHDLTQKARDISKDLFCGPMMQKMPNGFPTWGGVASLTHSGTSRPFTADDDVTGHFHTLHATARFHAVWIAVSPNRRMLLVSLYCYTSAQQDIGRQQSNEQLFKILFEMLAQYGDIPIAIAGDFQLPPHAYLTVAAVIRQSLWFDPLMRIDGENETRPHTYCRNCKWDQGDCQNVY